MTKQNLTSINIILDRSGSMEKLTTETLLGFNKFLAEQKAVEGEATLTLATFANDYTLIHDCAPLKDIADLTIETYKAGGYTALYDAIGKTINATGAKLASMNEEDRPSKVIVVVISDGEENRSREFTHDRVMDMILHQRDKYSWEVIYLGCDLSQVKTAVSLGINASNAITFVPDAAGIATSYSSVS